MSFSKFIADIKFGNLERIKDHICKGTVTADDCIRWACFYGRLEFVQYLFDGTCESQGDYIQWACVGGHMDVFEYLFKQGYPIRADHLKWACLGGNIKMVKHIKEHCFCSNIDSNEGIQWATEKGHIEIIKYFIDIKHLFIFSIL